VMDLTTLDKPFGLLDRATQMALFEAMLNGATIQFWITERWQDHDCPNWSPDGRYRVRPVAPLRCWVNRYDPKRTDRLDGWGAAYDKLHDAVAGAVEGARQVEMIEAEPIRAAAQGLVEALRRIERGAGHWSSDVAHDALATWEARQ
jgi:hypothetical protein